MNKTYGLLSNKVCLVTGAGRGIGSAIAERFSEEGATVYANDCRSIETKSNQGMTDNSKSGTIIPIIFDVTDHAAAKEAITQVRKEQGRLDVLVNNAGVVVYENLLMTDISKLRNMLEVNLIAVINLIQLASRLMARQKSGSVINIASIVGVQGARGQFGYSASKGAIISITKSAAKELAPMNIRVNSIAPGMIDTERFHSVFENNFSDRINDIGMGRLGTPSEVANACVFLASDLSEYISGQIIGIDGCTSLR